MLVLVKFDEIPVVSEAVEALLEQSQEKGVQMPSQARCKEVITQILADCNEMGEESKIPYRSREGMFFSGICSAENIITALCA